MKVRISDIAERAQVSTATVSLVINDKPGVGEEVRRKILAIAQEMNYQGRVSASKGEHITFLKLAKGPNSQESSRAAFMDDLIEGVSTAARVDGYAVNMAFISKFTPDVLEYYSDSEGFIALGSDVLAEDAPVINALQKPMVLLDSNQPLIERDQIGLDNANAVFQIVAHLKERGHRRVGFIRSDVTTMDILERERAYQLALKEFALEIDMTEILTVSIADSAALPDFGRLKSDDSPSAFICCDDAVALKAYQALILKGLRIPEDVSLVGCDCLPTRRFVHPPLTTFAFSQNKLGQTAFRALKNRLEKKDDTPPIRFMLQGELVQGQTVSLRR